MLSNIFFALWLILYAVGNVRCEVATQICKSQQDCLPTHCCSKRFMSPRSYCVPRRRLNELCIYDEVGSTMIDGVYDITCPCEGKLKCIRDLYTAPSGIVMSRGNARCREPNYPGSEYNGNSNSLSSRGYASNSYSNSETYGRAGNSYSNSYAYRR